MFGIILLGDLMKIEGVKKTKSGKYKITFDNKETISTYDDVILNNGLLFKKEVDNELLDKLNIETSYYDIYNKTIKFISRKLRSEKEVKIFLDKNNATNSDKKKIVTKLKDIKLINDSFFANAYCQDKMNLSNDGPCKIKKELISNDIEKNIIDEAMSKIDENMVYEKLTKLIIKKINSNHNKSNYMLKQKIVGDMINLGYSKEMIVEIIDSNLKSNKSVIENEYKKIYRKLEKKYEGEELERQVRIKLMQRGFSGEDINNIDI